MKTWYVTLNGEKIPNPEGGYYADPFLYKDYLFVEKFDHVKGVIAAAPLDTLEFETVLELDTHLSFPCIVDGYMIPEAMESGELAIYGAEDFPRGWKKLSTVLSGVPYADPVLYRKGKDYFVFVTTPDDNKLEIFKGHPEGSWERIYRQEHLYSRGAGNIYRDGSKLIRPTQDNQYVYGEAIFLKSISVEPYTEQTVGKITTDLIGTHTINREGDNVVQDFKYETDIHTP